MNKNVYSTIDLSARRCAQMGVNMKVLFMSSDNNRTSGAFLSMVKLNQLLKTVYGVETMVILPNRGDGDTLLEEADIAYKIIPSRNWVIDRTDDLQTMKIREEQKEAELSTNQVPIDEICNLIRGQKIDLVHINTSYSYIGAIAAEKMRIPVVWHIREFLEEDQNRRIWNRQQGYKLIKKSDAVVAISNSIYHKYRAVIGEERLHTIYNGIDENIFAIFDKKVFKSEISVFTIIGGVLPYKGQHELIKACGILKREGNSSFRVNIAGKCKPENQEEILRLIEQNDLTDHVILMGARDDIPEILEETDILFVCSKKEAFGRSTVEGMMAGCVVIGADTAGTKELIEDGLDGYLYKQGDAEELAGVIRYVVGNKQEAEAVRINGQQKALRQYTALRNAEEIYKLYEDVLKTCHLYQ